MSYIYAMLLIYGVYIVQINHPGDIEKQLRIYGERIKTARIRRRWSKQELATRMGVERRTVARMESGCSGIGIGVFLTAIWVLGLWDTVEGVVDPATDKVGMFLEKRREPKHVHGVKERNIDF